MDPKCRDKFIRQSRRAELQLEEMTVWLGPGSGSLKDGLSIFAGASMTGPGVDWNGVWLVD